MENNIIELRNWFRENGKMDFELNKNLPKTEQGKTITYNCKDIDNIFEIVLSNSKINDTATVEKLQTRIKELEGTIENMKAIAGEKIQQVGSITSVDYPSDNETELITVTEEVYNGCFSEITKTKCCGIAPITNENYCPNCGRKIIKK